MATRKEIAEAKKERIKLILEIADGQKRKFIISKMVDLGYQAWTINNDISILVMDGYLTVTGQRKSHACIYYLSQRFMMAKNMLESPLAHWFGYGKVDLHGHKIVHNADTRDWQMALTPRQSYISGNTLSMIDLSRA